MKTKSQKISRGGILKIQRKTSTRFRAWFPNGRDGSKQWLKTVDTRELAEEMLRDALSRDDQTPREALTLGQGVDRVLDRLRTRRRPGTVRWFETHARVLKDSFGEGTPLDAIFPATIEAFVTEKIRKVSASTVLHYKRALSLIYSDCKRFVFRNPLSSVEKTIWPSVRTPKTDYFEASEVQRIVEKIRASKEPTAEEDADLVSLFYLTGLRRSEVARLKVEDVNLEKRTISIEGKVDNTVARIDPETADVLERMVARVEGGAGALVPFGVERIANRFQQWSERLKEPRLHAHALRHSFCTALARSGRHLLEVQKLARHSSPEVTKRYFHLADDATPGLSLQPAKKKTRAKGKKRAHNLKLVQGRTA